MNAKTLLSLLAVAVVSTGRAQTQTGGITPQMLQEIRETAKLSPAERAVANALASNSIDELARTAASKAEVDTHFTYETPRQNIHDQKSSGRCWMFSGFNVLRANFAKAHGDSVRVEFSHAYTFFYDQLEKANLMLQGVIDNAREPMDSPRMQFFFKNPLNDGGTFCGVADLVDKYGVVPMGVMPETYSTENTSKMARIISSKLREYGLELRNMANSKTSAAAVRARKTEMLKTIYRMLVATIGEPVKEFTYTFKDKHGNPVGEPKTYTPLTFRDATVGRQLNGSFVMVMNDPRHPYYKTYEVEYDRHTYDGHNWRYLNLPMEEIAKLAIASIKDGSKMYSSYDVGKQLDRKRGYMDIDNFDYASLFGTTFPMNKAQRIKTFDSGSTHAMTLTAVDLDAKGNPVKWKVENSWGATSGFAGQYIMTNRWFNDYMFRLVVDKKYVPAELLKAYESKPVMLIPEDPLFGADN